MNIPLRFSISIFSLCLMFLLAPLKGWGGLPVFTQMDVSSGLANDRSRMVISLPDHRMMVAVDGMLCLYDGSRFHNLDMNREKSLAINNPIDDNWFLDRQGRLWIRGYNALYAVDTRTYTLLPVKDILKAANIKDGLDNFVIDNEGEAWLFTNKGDLYLYDWKSPARKLFRLPHRKIGLSVIWVMDVVRLGNKAMVFSSDGLITPIDVRSGRMAASTRFAPYKEGYRVKAFLIDKQRILLRLVRGLVCYNPATHKFTPVDASLNIMRMRTDNHGGVWAVGKSGIYHFDRNLHLIGNLSAEGNQWGMRQGNYDWQDIAVDWQGGLWLCSETNGVIYSDNGLRHSFFDFIPLEANGTNLAVNSISNDSKGLLWLATNNGLYSYNPRTGTYQHATSVLDGKEIVHISMDSQGLLWLSTACDGLFCYDPATHAVKNYSQGPQAVISLSGEFCKEIGPGAYLVCTHNNGLGVFYPATNHYVAANEKGLKMLAAYRKVNDACQIDGGFLVGTSNGFFVFDPVRRTIDTSRCRVLNESVYNNSSNVLFMDHNDIIWIGTQDGLLRYDFKKQSVKYYGNKEGLDNTFVTGIVEDKDHNLWITTANGIGYLSADRDYVHFLHRSSFENAQSDRFMERAITIDNQGQICIGTAMGLYILNPREMAGYKAPLQPQIMDFRLLDGIDGDGNRQSVSVFERIKDGHIQLDYKENYFSLAVSSLNYLYATSTIYRYKLDGIDKSWLTADDRNGTVMISYSALAPGDYTLHVQASMLGTKWSKEMVLHITVTPPIWATWWAYTLYVLLFIALTMFTVRRYAAQRKAKMEEERRQAMTRDQQRLNEMKFRFFTNVSHEFRTPLTLIITPLQTLLERTDMPDDAHKLLGVIQRSAQSLNTLVNQLLDFRSLEQKGVKLNLTVVHLDTIFEPLSIAFGELSKKRNIHFTVDADNVDKKVFHLDVPKVQQILNNLLSNAFKFTPEGGSITVKAECTADNHLHIAVSDSGVGISKTELTHVFDRFFQGHAETQGDQLNTGSGIGLNIVKGYTELHGGTVSVESEESKGTTFLIDIPDHVTEEEKKKVDVRREEAEEEMPDDGKAGKVKLLVVEDNRDFRDFMVDVLKNDYQVYAAADGEEALSTTRVTQPDIIISDVMMPKMDGYQLCRAVKQDVKLSHIPIILLTAKNTDEGRAEGYQAGADSYITKPFNMSVLQACVQMLLDQRSKRHEEFEQEAEVNPKKITITPVDEKFLNKAMQCMEKNMMEEDYDVVAFSSDMAMERSTLYRKMVAVVGKTPLQFMHAIRMKKAAKLLGTGEYSVGDVAVMVGYSSTKYFSQHFKKEYGVLPSKYK